MVRASGDRVESRREDYGRLIHLGMGERKNFDMRKTYGFFYQGKTSRHGMRRGSSN
jgi:hypothetical protein